MRLSLAGLCLAIGFFSSPAFAEGSGAPCQMPLLASLSTLVLPGGTVEVPITVNGRTLSLTADTGAIVTGISNSAVDQLGLEKHNSGYMFELPGNVQTDKKVRVSSVRIGGISTGETTMIVFPDFAMTGMDGLLGPDFMQNFDIEFDYAHAKFNVFAPASCPGKVVYWTKDAYAAMAMQLDEDWHVTVPVSLDGKPVTAVIDSGATHSFITSGELEKHFGIKLNSPGMQNLGKKSINGTVAQTVYRYPFSMLTLDGVSVKNPNIEVYVDGTYHPAGPQIVIGASVLRQLRVYISYKTKTLYATAAEAH